VAAIVITYAVVNGGIYALLAIGFSLIFGVARLVNMAHTGFFMLAAFGLYYCTKKIGLDYIEAIAVTIVVVTLLGILVYRFIIDRVREHHAAVLIITIALVMIMESALLWRFGGETRGVPSLIGGYVDIAGVRVLNQQLLTVGVAALAIIIVLLLLTKTKLGIAIRATAQDAEIASLMGISASRILLVTMGLSVALAVVAGILLAPLEGVRPGMWGAPLVTVMVIVTLGGLGSIKGSIIGAFIIALVEQMASFLIPNGGYLTGTIILLAMVIVLIVRPAGLFGTMFEEEKL
jgi:branched-chain amino acid transport system permease protein